MSKSFFESMVVAPADPIFSLQAAFEEDERKGKVNLSIGVYRDESLNTPVLECVKQAEAYGVKHEKTKEYLPIGGEKRFVEECGKLVFGKEGVCGVQTPGGTGALYVGGKFLREHVGSRVYIPTPTWPNHAGVFTECGFEVKTYNYYKDREVDEAAIVEMLREAPAGSVVLFHACCHNPTGADIEGWDELGDIVKERRLMPFFDFAYQGFGKGIEEDAHAVRLFAQRDIECLVASSYSKNFGLYGERVGALFVVTKHVKPVLSQLKIHARRTYSNPPKHGASIVSHILSDAGLKEEWRREVDGMRSRIEEMRNEFVRGIKGYEYLLNRYGMFCYLGLEEKKVTRLKEEYGIYMAEGGRINLAGLSRKNIQYVTESLNKIL